MEQSGEGGRRASGAVLYLMEVKDGPCQRTAAEADYDGIK